MTPAEKAAVTKTLETALGYLETKRTTIVEPKVPRAHAILASVLDETGYASAWEANSLTPAEHTELLHLVRMEGRRYFRELAIRTLDEIDDLESKALFGAVKDKVSGFFRGAKKYVRELFVAGVLAFAGPTPMDAAELRALDAEVAAQHAYLKTFEEETVAANKPPDGTFVARAEKYGAAVWGGVQEILRAGAKAERHYSSERRIHQAHDKPCPVCLEEMAKEWQPIGTLRKIGDSPCMMNCHCIFIYGWAEPSTAHALEDGSKSFDWDSKAYVPCRDARGRFASCSGGGSAAAKPDSKPKPGTGGGKKPRKPRKPGAKPAKPAKEPKPKKPAKEPAEKKPPKEQAPKKPAEKPKTPKEKPKESEPKASIREAMTARGGRSKDEVIHEYLVKHQAPAAPVQKHGMSEPESMSSIEIDGFRLHYPPPPAKFDPNAPVHPTVSTIRDYLSFGKDPLPHELARHTENVYMSTQANKADKHWQITYNNPDFRSGATGGDGDIVTYNTNRFTKHNVSHEMGHNLAKARYGGVDPRYGGDYANAIRSGEKAPSDYGKMNDAEDFAEGVKGYVRGPAHFAASWPKRAAVIKKMLEDPSYAG